MPEWKSWLEDMDEIEWEDDDDDMERLPCSLDYVVACLLLPFLNGCINGFSGSSIALYFKDMSWPLWHLGLALAGGFLLRLLTQRLQVRYGIWTSLPMALLHLTGAILAVVFTNEEWAILTEMVCLCAFDSSMAIEGISFDSFKDAPEVSDLARQATSTVLGVFTVSIALACTGGAVLFDAFSWHGLSIFHLSCQGSLFLLLLISPSCRGSLREYFFPQPNDMDDDEEEEEIMRELRVMPNQNATLTRGASTISVVSAVSAISQEAAKLEQKLPGEVDMALESMEAGQPGRNVSKVSFSKAEEGERSPGDRGTKVLLPPTEDQPAKEERISKVSFAQEVEKKKVRESGVTFKEGEEVQEHHTEDAPSIPKDETVDGMDYDQVGAEGLPKPQDDEAGTPNSQVNVYDRKKGSTRSSGKKSVVLVSVPAEDAAEVDALQDDQRKSQRKTRRASRVSRVSRVSKKSIVSRGSRISKTSRATGMSRISCTSEATLRTGRTADRAARERVEQWAAGAVSAGRRASRASRASVASKASMRSSRSNITSLAEAGANFGHHFMVNSSLGPKIVTRTGNEGEEEDDFGEEPPPLEDVPWAPRGQLQKTATVPMCLIFLCCMLNSFCYATEYSTFSIFFREYYGLTSATTGALGQTAGDFLAAMAMQANTVSGHFAACAGCLRIWDFFAYPPYCLSWTLLLWALLNLAMFSGALPVAIAGQVLMSSAYCFTSRFSQDLVFFYTRGDLKAFMRFNMYLRSSEAFVAAVANFLGLFLLEAVDVFMPYLVGVCLAMLVFLLYTNGFCSRLSCENIVTAEEKRLNQ